MADVTLTLKADTSNYVQKMKEASLATQKLYDESSKGSKKLTGIIEKEEANLKKLQEWKRKASADNLEMYNKEIAASQKRLEAYDKAGTDVENTNQKITKSGGGMINAVKDWALGFASVTIAIQGFKAIIESTDTLSDKFVATLNGWKEGFSAMARAIANNDFKDFFKNVKEAVKEGQRYTETEDKIGDAARAMKIRIAENETALIKLREAQNSAKLSNEERLKAGLAAEALIKKDAEDRLKLAEMVLDNEMTNAAFKAQTSKEIVKQYLDQNEALLKNIEIGKQYNALQKRLQVINLPSGGTAPPSAAQIQANIDERKSIESKLKVLGTEAIAYGALATGLGNLTDAQKDKITADYEGIEAANQSAINLRVSSRVDAMSAKDMKVTTDVKKKEYDKRLDDEKKFLNASQKLLDDYAKSNIESLSGVDKLKAQRDLGLKQLAETRKQLEAAGTLTPEIENAILGLGSNIWKAFVDGLVKEAKLNPIDILPIIIEDQIKTLKTQTEDLKLKLNLKPDVEITADDLKVINADPIKKKMLEQFQLVKTKLENSIQANADVIAGKKIDTSKISEALRDSFTFITPDFIEEDITGIKKLPGIVKRDVEQAQKDIQRTVKANKTGEEFSFWKVVGLNPEDNEDAKMISSIEETAATVMGIMDEMTQRRVDDAQRNRELLDTQIAEKQREVDTETELMKKGYASNVAGKKAELAALQKQRDIALKKEEEAIKRQQALASIQQSTSLVIASANLMMNAKTPLGIAAAIIAIGAMFAAFVAAKKKATEVTKFAEGGWTGAGKERDETGRKVAGIVHEREFVVREGPATRFRDVLEAINRDDRQLVINRFTKLSPEVIGGTSINNVTVENTGPNKRLDQVNNNLKQLKAKEEIFELADATIIIKNGNRKLIKR